MAAAKARHRLQPFGAHHGAHGARGRRRPGRRLAPAPGAGPTHRSLSSELARAASALLLALLPALAFGEPAKSPEQVWSAYAERWASTNDYAASFRQTINLGEVGGHVESAGRFFFAKPDRMLWKYEEGPPQTVVGDGVWIWVYQPDLEQVYKVDYSQAFGSGGLVALLAARQGLETRYRVTLPERGDGLVHMELVPRVETPETVENGAQKIEVAMTPDTFDLREVTVTDVGGAVTRVAFFDTRRNEGLDAALFSFTPPPGVDIIADP